MLIAPLLAAPLLAPLHLQDDPAADQLAAEALAVLGVRCGSCHMPEADDRKAVRSWEDASDVAAMIEEAIIEPGKGSLSYLIELIDEGDMPPEDASSGQVTPEERAALVAWIDAGAPAPGPRDNVEEADPVQVPEPDPGAPDPAEDPAEDPVADPAEKTTSENTTGTTTGQEPETSWKNLGALHPLIVHFPIALLLATLVSELLVAAGAGSLRVASRFCAWLGFAGALAAGATGWLLGAEATRRGLETHRWLGVASTFAALWLCISLEQRSRSRGSRRVHVLIVAVTAVLISIAAHRGGVMTWGSDHLRGIPILGDLLG